MTTSADREATSNHMEWLRLYKSGRLVKETFSSDELIALAHQSGYRFLNSQILRNWTRRQVFPPAPTESSRSGGRFTGGRWPREDALRLLDTCWLHEQNCRGRALQLGLWLLSYSQTDGTDPQELLVEQIERMEEGVFGQVLPADLATLSDDEQDRIAERMRQVVEKPGHYLLDALCAELPMRRMRSIGPYFEELREQHPQTLARVSVEELKRFTTLRHAGDERLAPLPDAWGAMAPYLAERMRRLNQLLRLKKPPAPDTFKRIIEATSPNGDAPNVPASNLSSEELTALQRDLVAMILWDFAELLPQLRQTLANAGSEELRKARTIIASGVLDALTEERYFPDPELTGLTWFGERAHWDVRLLFAAPAFFPLIVYLIAALVFNMRYGKPPIVGDHVVTSPPPIVIRHEVLPAALDQLARLMRESTSRAEAFLTIMFCAIPVPREEMNEPL